MKYNIPKNTINDWFRDFEKYKNAIKTGKKKLPGGGRKSKLLNLEKDLLYYILDVRRSGYAINVNTIIAYIHSLDENFKILNINTLRSEISTILRKCNLKIRKSTHIGQPLPENAIELVYSFLYNTIKQRRYLCIGDDEIGRTINCDETALYLENPSTKTIDINGKKELFINTEGNEDKKNNSFISNCY